MHNIILIIFLCCSHIVAEDADGELIDFGDPNLGSATVVTTTTTTSPTAEVDCSQVAPQWLAWSDWTACSDQCGSCGIHMRTRACLTTHAQCSTCEGEATLIEHCNLEICRYPRVTCCNNLKVQSLKGRFACLAEGAATVRPRT